MKILLVGHISYNLIAPYTRGVKQIIPTSKISVLGLNRPGSEITEEHKLTFDEVLEKPAWTTKELYKTLFTYQFLKELVAFLFIGQKKAFKIKTYLHFKQNVINLTTKMLDDEFYVSTFKRFDIVNFEYIDRTSTKYLPFISKKNKIVLTFWGSDLMATAGVELYTEQLKLVDRANIVVVHSLQMREIFLSKYGRQYLDKVRLNYFGLEDMKFNRITQAEEDKEGLKKYAQEWGIPDGKIKLLIGYSGAKSTRHQKILVELAKRKNEWKDKFHLVIPMTYNNEDQDYFEKVKNTIETGEYSYTHITEYLTDNEVAYLYNLIDVFINVRESDAFNAAMVETLFLNKINIVGSWLPYNLIRRAGIDFLEVNKIGDINTILEQVLEGELTKSLRQNKQKIYNLTSNNYTIPKWCDLYKELYEMNYE
jgi:hypothetical protein